MTLESLKALPHGTRVRLDAQRIREARLICFGTVDENPLLDTGPYISWDDGSKSGPIRGFTSQIADRITLEDPSPLNVARAVAHEFLPLYDVLTTSDLQSCIDAAVTKHGLEGAAAWEAGNLALDRIYDEQAADAYAEEQLKSPGPETFDIGEGQ